MKAGLSIVGFVLASAMSLPPALQAQTTDFEDVPGAVSEPWPDCNWLGYDVPVGYAGFSWVNFFALDQNCNPDVAGGVHSGNWAVSNGFGMQAAVISNGLFTFQGAWFASYPLWGAPPPPTPLMISGFSGGSLVYLDFLELTESSQYFALNWSDIDEIRFGDEIPENWFVMDDMATLPGQVIPEPATMILLATGLAGLAAHRRRRRGIGSDAG